MILTKLHWIGLLISDCDAKSIVRYYPCIRVKAVTTACKWFQIYPDNQCWYQAPIWYYWIFKFCYNGVCLVFQGMSSCPSLLLNVLASIKNRSDNLLMYTNAYSLIWFSKYRSTIDTSALRITVRITWLWEAWMQPPGKMKDLTLFLDFRAK